MWSFMLLQSNLNKLSFAENSTLAYRRKAFAGSNDTSQTKIRLDTLDSQCKLTMK
ncbi:hypothetical protein JCM6292_2589 [Bacteroides pyogenes JCM 6292]|uniref:Uncharacterized protein n=2 Tax=Bacteroides pyogenes TaxID=310300 RepID=W4PIG6_9BACE|nr:hypothetical protein JCM6292_2589 [Bacteroides pyogenes JCM 6292]GAE19616.1 hypothetical protein JCM6294_2695 [Bacteroides pyogenes DSM 20611 = JCM 6294]